MLVARLALRRGGPAIDNPMQWLASLPRETLDFWEAFNTLEPIGQEWRQTAQISYLTWLANSTKQNNDISEDSFMGPDYIAPPKTARPTQHIAAVAASIGLPASKHVGRPWRP